MDWQWFPDFSPLRFLSCNSISPEPVAIPTPRFRLANFGLHFLPQNHGIEVDALRIDTKVVERALVEIPVELLTASCCPAGRTGFAVSWFVKIFLVRHNVITSCWRWLSSRGSAFHNLIAFARLLLVSSEVAGLNSGSDTHCPNRSLSLSRFWGTSKFLFRQIIDCATFWQESVVYQFFPPRNDFQLLLCLWLDCCFHFDSFHTLIVRPYNFPYKA